MTDIQQQPSSHTESRTQKSPQRQNFAINYLSNHTLKSHQSNNELDYFRFKQEAKRQVQNYLKQIQLLKDQLFRKNSQIQHLKSVIIMNLKKDLNDAQRDNIKNYKQNQRQARQIEKLRSDNFNMQQDLEKNLKQKRTYFAKLQDLKQLKQTTKRQILQKDKIIRTYAQQNKKLQKQVANLKLQVQDFSDQINQKQKKLFESESEYKSILQKIFITQSQLKNLHLRQRDHQVIINDYRAKIEQLQREREELREKVDDFQSRNVSQDRFANANIKNNQLIQIKSLMDQIENLVDEKKHSGKQVQKKFLASILCLQKSVSRK